VADRYVRKFSTPLPRGAPPTSRPIAERRQPIPPLFRSHPPCDRSSAKRHQPSHYPAYRPAFPPWGASLCFRRHNSLSVKRHHCRSRLVFVCHPQRSASPRRNRIIAKVEGTASNPVVVSPIGVGDLGANYPPRRAVRVKTFCDGRAFALTVLRREAGAGLEILETPLRLF
jgi:hypothetical protein